MGAYMDGDIKVLEKFLNILVKRNNILTSNVANAETPGYFAKDIDYKTILQEEIVNLEKTSHEHLSGSSEGIEEKIKIVETSPWIDKNNVELDKEMAKLTENALVYQAGITFLGTKFRMYKNAVRGR